MRIAIIILICIVVGPPVAVIVFHAGAKVVRGFRKRPMPAFMANVIDNRLRYTFQPPEKTAARHGLEPGMVVLEVGPGSGTYTLAAARSIGQDGKLVAVDIQPEIVEMVSRRAKLEGVANVEVQLADVNRLPFADATFDAIFMIFVIGEIPEPERAMKEFRRVLSPPGTIAFTEHALDPDYPRQKTLMRWAEAANFRLKKKLGNVFFYTMIFEKKVAESLSRSVAESLSRKTLRRGGKEA